ncbi:MAG: hypothetical protein LBU43_04670 [Candidatus Accumulibacter sp.]|jgi:hypothetical protein|nr:hypothetical protein [Accumulibacter sp.]
MRTTLFFISLIILIALPVFTLKCSPDSAPGAPGLESPPALAPSVEPPESAPPPPVTAPPAVPSAQQAKRKAAPPKTPAACAKAKNVKLCVARQEQRRKARAACKGETGEARQQCVGSYLNRRKK